MGKDQNKPYSVSNNVALGKYGEAIAVEHLIKCGYSILAKNFRAKCGEVDIIAKKEKSLVFVEVKTRESLSYGFPEEAISKRKIGKIKSLARLFVATNNSFSNFDIRFDLISIVIDKTLTSFNNRGSYNRTHSLKNFEIKHIENAF
ncbi:MAG: YraN family protein [Actinobacteria bacterium]|nr:YraN family protein [Actinomycetota bacterium]